ncbi:MAG: PEP-CTERM sorting domain-containing protein [Phycisphaerales bacterium JB058]
MKTTVALIAALAAGAASAQTVTQVIPFDYDVAIDVAFPEFQLFDTMGGTRELIGVTLSYDQSISITSRFEQNSPISIAADNFYAEISYISIHQLGLVDDNPNPPFLGPGAGGASISVPELGPSDGYNGSGPDTYVETVDTGMFNFTAAYDHNDLEFLDVFTGQGTLTTLLGGFSEIFAGYNSDPGFPAVDPNNPPDGPFFPFQDPYYGVFVELPSIRHQGTITATFEYRNVPAPASLALLGMGAFGAARRRRS